MHELALSEQGQGYKVKHSRYSQAKLAEAREALVMVHTLADEFAAEVAQLCASPSPTTSGASSSTSTLLVWTSRVRR